MTSMKYSLGALLLTGLSLSTPGAITVKISGLSPIVCPVNEVTYIDTDCAVSGESKGDGVRLRVTKSCTVTFDGLNCSSSVDGFTPVSLADGISAKILLKGVNSISPGQGACAIYVPTNSTLTIDSAPRTDGENLPELHVIGRWNCAAIGGHGPCPNNGNTRCDGGNIIIDGGKIVSEKDPDNMWGQTLGGSWGARAGKVTINGGTLELNTRGSIAAETTTINGGSMKFNVEEDVITYTSGVDTELTVVRNSRGAALHRAKIDIDASATPGMKVFFPKEDYGCKDIECIDNSIFLWLSEASHQLQVIGAGSVITYSLVWERSGFKVSANSVPGSQVMFDGTLVSGGQRLGNASATAIVRVDGKDQAVEVKTDDDGRFAASLPSSATPAAEVTLKQITVGNETIPFGQTLNIPKLPSALKAEYADNVLSDSEVTVVDSDVTVLGDLRLTGTSLGEGSGQLERTINGGITVGRPSPAKVSFLNSITAPTATRIYGIGSPIVEMDAAIKGKIEKTKPSETTAYNVRIGFLYAYLSPRSSETMNNNVFYGDGPSDTMPSPCPATYTISKAQNFRYVLANSAYYPVENQSQLGKYRIDPKDLYKLFLDKDENYIDYVAPADGFVTVSVTAPDKTFGGIAVSMDLIDRDKAAENRDWFWPFALGWHRSPGTETRYPANKIDRATAQLPKFNRAYTAVMRKGDHMHLRVLLEPNAGFQDPSVNTDIDLSVKVVFRPLGFVE